MFDQLSFFLDEKRCISGDARKADCSHNEYCVLGICQCLPGYISLNNDCIRNKTDQLPKTHPTQSNPVVENDVRQNHLAIVIVIPVLLLLVLIGTGIVVRKYNLVNWIRNKINQRDTPYDEVMIGQDDDDPPLSGV